MGLSFPPRIFIGTTAVKSLGLKHRADSVHGNQASMLGCGVQVGDVPVAKGSRRPAHHSWLAGPGSRLCRSQLPREGATENVEDNMLSPGHSDANPAERWRVQVLRCAQGSECRMSPLRSPISKQRRSQ